jgi:hypothetical protein
MCRANDPVGAAYSDMTRRRALDCRVASDTGPATSRCVLFGHRIVPALFATILSNFRVVPFRILDRRCLIYELQSSITSEISNMNKSSISFQMPTIPWSVTFVPNCFCTELYAPDANSPRMLSIRLVLTQSGGHLQDARHLFDIRGTMIYLRVFIPDVLFVSFVATLR